MPSQSRSNWNWSPLSAITTKIGSGLHCSRVRWHRKTYKESGISLIREPDTMSTDYRMFEYRTIWLTLTNNRAEQTCECRGAAGMTYY